MRSCQFEHEVTQVPTREMDEIDSPPPLPGPIQGFMYKKLDNTGVSLSKVASYNDKYWQKFLDIFPTVFLISENGQVYSSDDQFSYIPDNDLTCFGESFVPPFKDTGKTHRVQSTVHYSLNGHSFKGLWYYPYYTCRSMHTLHMVTYTYYTLTRIDHIP